MYRWMSPIVDPVKVAVGIKSYIRFLRDWATYSRLDNDEKTRFIDTYPCLFDKTAVTKFDRHYFYQDIWAFRKIYESKSPSHVDVGSRIDFVGFLTTVTDVTFIDIRPLEVNLPNFKSISGNVLSMPYPDSAVQSLSCLHVAEHVGLGRYGDSLDPAGTQKACKELSRILAKGGDLFFSLPVGKPRVCFNAHRIHTVDCILDYFSELKLFALDGIDDAGRYYPAISKERLNECDYGCGLFWFKKLHSG